MTDPAPTGSTGEHPASPGLRQQVLRGGKYLVWRQGLGVGIALFGVLLLTRLIGPADYGLYAGALAIVTFTASVTLLGVEVYLVRREEPPDRRVYDQAFTLLLACGVAVALIAQVAVPTLEGWFTDARFLAPLQVLLLALPVMLISHPPLAALERNLDFRRVAFLELTGQLGFYVVALTLAFGGAGVWAPVTAFWVWQVWLALGSHRAARYRPRLVWSTALLREMLSYGLAYSASGWIWGLRTLVNPLIIGRFLGAESVGYVSLALRLVDVLSFVRDATWRLSIASLAKVQGEYDRLRRVVDEAMVLQVLGVAPLLGVGAAGLWLLPAVLGEQWEPVSDIFPLLALASLVNAIFNMHASVLYVLKRNGDVALFHAVYIVVLAGAAVVLVPAVGLVGYGLAELVAMVSYGVLHWKVTKLFPLTYRRSILWVIGLAPPMFAVLLPLPWGVLLLLPAVAPLAVTNSRRLLLRYAYQLLPRSA